MLYRRVACCDDTTWRFCDGDECMPCVACDACKSCFALMRRASFRSCPYSDESSSSSKLFKLSSSSPCCSFNIFFASSINPLTRLEATRNSNWDFGTLLSSANKGNSRNNSPLFIQTRILDSLYRIGGQHAIKTGAKLALTTDQTKDYWKKRAKKLK